MHYTALLEAYSIMAKSFTAMQLAFIEAMVLDDNKTKAALSAGYAESSASVRGFELSKDPVIAAEIERRRAENSKKSQLSAEKLYEALSQLVGFDPGEAYDSDGKLLAINKMPIAVRKALAGTDGEKLRFSSRLGAIELSAKLLGMLKEQQTQQTAVQITIAAPPELPKADPNRPQLLPEW